MICNLPNILGVIRIISAPLMFWILLNVDLFFYWNIDKTWAYYFAGLIFVLACITDFFDGFIARKLNQKTYIGTVLDPLADKMLMIGAFLGLSISNLASPWAVYLILVRELFITGLRVLLAKENLEVFSSIVGKTKTVVQMFAIGFLIMHWPYANEILWFSVFLSLYSGFEYTRHFLKVR